MAWREEQPDGWGPNKLAVRESIAKNENSNEDWNSKVFRPTFRPHFVVDKITRAEIKDSTAIHVHI